MTQSLQCAVAATLLVVIVDPATAGSYLDIANCIGGPIGNPATGCHLNPPAVQHPLCAPDCEVTPNGITHPLGYTGTQPNLQIRICVDAAHPELVPIVDAAIEMWEKLEPRVYNCWDCGTWEHPPGASGDPFAFSVVLHELGHCALGLDHVDRFVLNAAGTSYEDSSFTRSVKAARVVGAIDDGLDDIRGSSDDFHAGILGPAESMSWFRTDDNDPFIVDPATTIDILKYTTALPRLPALDTWGASANMCVFDPTLCDPSPPLHNNESQAVMYSGIGTQSLFYALGADDVNMLKMARTGVDRLANTPDDYTVDLQNVGDCSHVHEVKVTMAPGIGGLGVCRENDINYSFDPGDPLQAKHFSVVFRNPGQPLIIELESTRQWDYAIPVFASSFEVGDTSDWSSSVP